jgi:riboflavin kinase/FMN adenylyltransferase
MKFMAVGSNFRCGYKLDTDALSIQKLNAELDIITCIVQPLAEGGQPISSSYIRAAIAQGKLNEANEMLGRPFTVDLFGASVSHTACGVAYDIADHGGILPPPGKYKVLLLEKNCAEIAGKPADIMVEDGSIIIAENLTGICPEYVKF